MRRGGRALLKICLKCLEINSGAGECSTRDDKGSVQLPAPRFHALHVERGHHVRVVGASMDPCLAALIGILFKAGRSRPVGPCELAARPEEQGRGDDEEAVAVQVHLGERVEHKQITLGFVVIAASTPATSCMQVCACKRHVRLMA